MRPFVYLLLWLVVGWVFVAQPAFACPSCEAALAAPADAEIDDPLREARAFNTSILFMVAVPYTLLAGCALGLFVLHRKKVRLDQPPD